MEQRDDMAGTILYVDDEELARKYFVRTAGVDYSILTANDANSAMRILQAEGGRIGVVVTDFRMPGRDGGDLLRQIEQEYPNVVRMLTTAYADKTLLLNTINSADVFCILEKPLDLEEVRRALRLALELARDRISNRQKIMAMNETLAFLAHELNTPLATIVNFSRGIAQRLSDGHVDLYAKDGAGSPCNPAEQMRDVGGRAAIAKAAISVNDNARYCLTVLSSFVDSVRNRGLNFGGETGSAASQLLASLLDTYPMMPEQRSMIAVHIEQDFRISALPNCVALVLSSVIGNALRALHGRSAPQIHITLRVSGEPQILIADNGPGIPPHVLERLMVDPITTHAAVGGSGRGIIFCHRIMQSFGGSLHIESEPEQCTTVTLIFPAVRDTIKRSA